VHALWDGSEYTDLVAGSGIEFHDRGEHELRGVRGAWRLFAVRANLPGNVISKGAGILKVPVAGGALVGRKVALWQSVLANPVQHHVSIWPEQDVPILPAPAWGLTARKSRSERYCCYCPDSPLP